MSSHLTELGQEAVAAVSRSVTGSDLHAFSCKPPSLRRSCQDAPYFPSEVKLNYPQGGQARCRAIPWRMSPTSLPAFS